MCKIGDIIVVETHIGDNGKKIPKHSFIVIADSGGYIEGISYDFVATIMSSFKNKSHREKKLRFKENFEILSTDIIAKYKNNKDGYVKADQITYFKKDNIKYYKFGELDKEVLTRLMILIISLDNEGKSINNINNLVY